MIFTKNYNAASLVFGTILMVAVTVILEAVIASYLFGSAHNVQIAKLVAAKALMTTGGDVDITYQGGPETDSLIEINITAPNGSVSTYTNPKIGDVMILHPISPISDWPAGQKHVDVVGTFNNGASQVILDTMV